MTITVYGIPNCDAVKKSRDWLTACGLVYAFHDYKKAGIDPARLAVWCEAVGWERLLNRAGTTFRKLPEAERSDLDQAKAIAIMLANPSCIKRPVVEHGEGLLVGFKAADWAEILP